MSDLIGLRSRLFPRQRTKPSCGLGLTSAHDASSIVISVKKKKHHDDDDDDDDDNALEQCTIQKPNSGMGCVAPLKLKCEKMKNGQKCCGCVGDKNAKTQQPPGKTAQPQAKTTKTLCHTLVSEKVVEVFKKRRFQLWSF
jgi:hypothetical protein